MTITEELMRFHFTEMEARIYVTLVRHGRLNGSQIARMLSANRSSVYTALNHLTEKGALFSLTGDPTEYVPEDPETLIERFSTEYSSSLSFLKEELNKSKQVATDQQYRNIRGREHCTAKAKELIESARTEICLHTNFDLGEFTQELAAASARGVRIIAFSFVPVHLPEVEIELYRSEKFNLQESPDKRLMLVSDMRHALIAGGNESRGFLGTQAENSLFVAIVAEHIHHDIYLERLDERFGRNVVDDSIKIQSLLEQQFTWWISHLASEGPESKHPKAEGPDSGGGRENAGGGPEGAAGGGAGSGAGTGHASAGERRAAGSANPEQNEGGAR